MTLRYGLIPYRKQISFFCKSLTKSLVQELSSTFHDILQYKHKPVRSPVEITTSREESIIYKLNSHAKFYGTFKSFSCLLPFIFFILFFSLFLFRFCIRPCFMHLFFTPVPPSRNCICILYRLVSLSAFCIVSRD